MKVFKNFAISGKIIFLLIFISSINPKVCKSEGFFTPYRLFFGLKRETTLISEKVDYGTGSSEEPLSQHVDPVIPSWANLEFSPNYLGDLIGYYIYISNRKFNVDTGSLEVNLNSTVFAIPFYLYLGDKNLGKDGKFSFRIGYGPNLTLVSNMEFFVKGPYGEHHLPPDRGIYVGETYMVDVILSNITIKFEQSTFENEIKYMGYPVKLTTTQLDTSIGFYYYF